MKRDDKDIIEKEHLTIYQKSVAADAYIVGQYDNLENGILSHIEICSKCKSEILLLTEVLKKMDNEGVKQYNRDEFKSNDFPKKIRLSNWVAAASIILLAIVSISYLINSDKYESEILVLKDSLNKLNGDHPTSLVDSLKLQISQDEGMIEKTKIIFSDSLDILSNELDKTSKLLSHSFTDNDLFEEQIEMNLRSPSIVVLSSKYIEQSYGKNINLSWKTENSSTKIIALYNNKGLLVLKEEGAVSAYLLSTKELLPGVYYWKLIGKEGVIFIGKITLK